MKRRSQVLIERHYPAPSFGRYFRTGLNHRGHGKFIVFATFRQFEADGLAPSICNCETDARLERLDGTPVLQ
jgi:hypothetical protein